MLNNPQPASSISRPPSVWKRFWSLPLPHKVRTCWWRLLHGKLYLYAALHKWDPERWDSPLCHFCNREEEDTKNFCVSCPLKWPFWVGAIASLAVIDLHVSSDAVLHSLVNLTFLETNLLPDDKLIKIGHIICS